MSLSYSPAFMPGAGSSRRKASFSLLALVALTAGCGQNPPASAGGSEASSTSGQAKQYRLKGIVRRVDRKTGRVFIRHDEIPGFMPTMTMPFNLKDDPLLEELQVGDEVQGRLEVDDTIGTVLRELEITFPAVASPPQGTESESLQARQLAIGVPVPDFEMTRQDGETLRLSDLRGKVVILTFVYTRCPLPEFCPLLDQKFRALADRLQAPAERAEKVRLLSVSFDPEHDTPEVLARHARLRGAHMPLWTFAAASHEELRKVAEPLGLSYGPTQTEIIHTLSTAVIDAEGRLARLETGRAWTPESLLEVALDLIRDRIPGPDLSKDAPTVLDDNSRNRP